MKKLQLASTVIVTALMASNIILVNQYKHDTENYEQNIRGLNHEISNQSKIIKRKEDKNNILIDSLHNKDKKIHSLRGKLDQLRERLNNIFPYEVTAYSPYFESTGKTVGDPDYKITASGERVQQGKSIACPSSLAFGTKVNIQNVGLRVCTDRGGKIKGKHIDVYFDSVKDALDFGRQTLLVEVKE